MGLLGNILSEVIKNTFENLNNNLETKTTANDYNKKGDYDEKENGQMCSAIIAEEKIIPEFYDKGWVECRKALINYLWRDHIGYGKDIPNKETIRKMSIWGTDTAIGLLYSDSYILWKIDKFVDKLNSDSEKYYIDLKLKHHLSNEDNFINFFDGIKENIVNKAKEDKIDVDQYEPTDEIIDKYIDLKEAFNKLYYTIDA